MPLACKGCYYEVSQSQLYRHLSVCTAFREQRSQTELTELDRLGKHWPPHEFTKKGYIGTDGGLPDPHKMQKDVIWNAIFEPWLRPSVETELIGMLNSTTRLGQFQHQEFAARIQISKLPYHPKIYYRKMSQGEWDAVKDQNNPFAKTFDYVNTDNYRYWMSSSLNKVQAFGNANAADAGGVIVRIVFDEDPLARFKDALIAHQQPGAQGDASKVAVHREGFAEIGNMSTLADLQEVIGPPVLHHNLGFTSQQCDVLNQIKTSFDLNE